MLEIIDEVTDLLGPRKSDFIKTFCEMYDMKNLIVAPTCLKGPVPTLLDVILVTKPRRFAGTLNCECILSDFHNFIGAATKKYAPTAEPRKIIYRSYKKFNDLQFIDDVFSTPFHVAKIFDDVDDASWFTSSLLNDIIDYHVKLKWWSVNLCLIWIVYYARPYIKGIWHGTN